MMNLKKFTAMLAVFTAVSAINAKADNEEAIELKIDFLSTGRYEKVVREFTPLDLREYVNRDFTDSVAGDGEGGWSDQGENDMREFPFRGITEFLNVPFDIIEPSENDGKAVLAVQGQNDKGVSNRCEIAIGQKAGGLYFLHSSPWANGSYVGKYTLKYQDGTGAYLNIFDSVHISDCYGKTSSDNFRPVWTGKNAVLDPLSLYLFAMNNPYPDKEIKSLVIETDGNGPYIMVAGITLTDKEPYLPASELMTVLNPDTDDWIETKEADIRGSVLDMSYLLDAPAGKHGRLLRKGEYFVFEDGTKAKLWGTNITGDACFPEKKKSEELASEIAACGFNLVRFSCLTENYTVVSDSDKEKLSYFISRLAEKGVYSSIAGSRTDKLEVFFKKENIEREKEFFKDLLTYKARDSKDILGNLICMTEFVDGASMYDLNAGKKAFNAIESEKYLNDRFNTFIKSKYGNNERLKKAWNGEYDLSSWESIGELDLIYAWNNPIYSVYKKHDIMEFFNHIQTQFYDELKNELVSAGVKSLMTSNSNSDKVFMMGDTYMGINTDFSARNILWETPVSDSEMLLADGWYNGKNSNVRSSSAGMFYTLASQRPYDTPYVITKWGTSFLNRYSCELPFMMAAISAQQNWTPVSYCYMNGQSTQNGLMEDHYSIYRNPAYLGMMPAAAVLHKSMPEVSQNFVNSISGTEILMGDKVNPVASVKLLSEKSSVRKSQKTLSGKRLKYDSDIIRNENIYWDKKDGIFFAETDKAEAVTGFFTGEEVLKHFNVRPKDEFAAVSLCCLEGKTFDTAKGFLLTLAGRARNKELFINNRARIESIGEDATVAERIKAEITVKIKGELRVYALDCNGRRCGEIKTEKNSDGFTVINIDSEGKSVNFEIERIAN